ncbi:MAG: CBS domain-containing protein [Candidatus Rokuibacteriota bacterium]
MQVMSWMSTPVHTVTPPTRAAEAAALMRQHRIHHLPVIEGDRVVGVVTDRDLRGADGGARVSTIMSRPVVVVSPRTAIDKAARLLFERRIGCLPVIEEGKLVGILTQTDAVTALVDVVRLQVGGRASEVMVAYRPDAMALAHRALRPLGVEVARLVVATLDPIGRGLSPERVRLQIESRDMPRVLDALRDAGLTVLATEPPKTDDGRA